MGKVYKHADGFAYRKIADIGVILPVGVRKKEYSNLFQLSDVGDLIWRSLDGQVSTEDILQTIVNEYNVGEEQARADMDLFLDEMASKGLIVECAPA